MTPRYCKLLPAIKALLPQDKIDALGRDVQFVRRLRVITSTLFVWAVVLSRFGQGHPGFSEAGRWFKRLAGRSVQRRAFQLRFKKKAAVVLMQKAFERAVEPWRHQRPRAKHPLCRYLTDVVAIDCTVVPLSDRLRRYFKGLRQLRAALKVSFAVSLFGHVPLWARLAPGNRYDSVLFPPLKVFRPGSLLLFDKAFVKFDRLGQIAEAGHYFLCPMRRSGNPRLRHVAAGPRRLKRAVRRTERGPRLRQLLARGQNVGKSWDLDVMLGGWSRSRPAVSARLVVLRGPHGQAFTYLTNLPRDIWSPETLREMYRLRWQIELVFKELKQHCNLTSVPSKDRYAVQVFVWASLLALTLSRTVCDWLYPLHRTFGLMCNSRTALVTRTLASARTLIVGLLTSGARDHRVLLRLLRGQLTDEAAPTISRRADSFQRIENQFRARIAA